MIVNVVDLLLRLPLQFPEAAPDMFWMDPAVHYADGRAPVNTNAEVILGRSWETFDAATSLALHGALGSTICRASTA